MEKHLSVIEFTQKNIRLLTGYENNGQLYVMQALESEDLTIENGLPAAREATDSLLTLINTAKQSCNVDIGPYVLLVPPVEFKTAEVNGFSATASMSDTLTIDDYNACAARAFKSSTSGKERTIFSAPFIFEIDDRQKFKDFPVNVKAKNMSANFDTIVINADNYEFYKSILKNCGIVSSLDCISSFTGAKLIEKYLPDSSYLLLELQKEYSYLTYMNNGRIKFSIILDHSLETVVKAAGKKLNVDFERANYFLNTFAFFAPVGGYEYYTDENLTLTEVRNVLMNSFRDIAIDIQKAIEANDIASTVPLVISGPGATIDEIAGLFSHLLARDSKAFLPHIFGAQDEVYVDSLGAIYMSNFPYLDIPVQGRKISLNNQLRSAGFDR